jgi:DNA-binding MarR family transcriptional regulator
MSPFAAKRTRAEQTQHVSTQLLGHSALLIRLLGKEVDAGFTLTEGGILKSLRDGPRRITELAELEGLAQPTTTLLVKRLEEQRLVRRERQSDDQRVVLVWLTDEGAAAFEDYKSRAFAALRGHLDAMPDTQLMALAAATDAVGELINTLLRDAPRRAAGA